MKFLNFTTLLVLATLSGPTFAQQRRQALPEIPAPRELKEVSSDFAEGTITRLSDQDVALFLPWAQNAQSVLTKAIRDAETMTVQNQVRHLTNIMKSVVRNSAQKNYQLFMRFALNRTLLLVQELTAQSDWNVPGTVENVLDLQVRGINLALEFYESDLAYQRRVARGQSTVALEYARFGAAFGKAMLSSIQNVTDASAQYRLLYKTLEMINWDFSRDTQAIDFADTIVEIFNTLNTLEEQPGNDDYQSVLAIRRLTVLLGPVRTVERIILMSNEESRRQIEEQERNDRMRSALTNGIGVIVENTFFIINGASQAELYSRCIAQVPGGSIDEIAFATGGKSLRVMTNSSYYWNKEQVCQNVLTAQTFQAHDRPLTVYGSVEERSFTFSGTSITALMYQCSQFYTTRVQGLSIDQMTIGVYNNPPVPHTNSSYYWNSMTATCGTIFTRALSQGL